MWRMLGCAVLCAVLCVGLTSCQPASDQKPADRADVPVGTGPFPAHAMVWAVGGTVHVDQQAFRVGKPVRAMVEGNGRIFLLQGRSDVVRVTDGGRPVSTSLRADELSVSEDGRYLGLFDKSEGPPWSTVVVDLSSGEIVVRDDTGMGGSDDDFADLYGDAQPGVLGFDGDEFFVRTAEGNEVVSWDVRSGSRTEHGDGYFARPDPGGGRALPALVRGGRLVVPKDPYRSTQPGHLSPDGSVAVMPVDGRSEVFAVRGGQRLAADLRGRRFILGGWTSAGTAYGLAFDGRAFGPRPVHVVTCRLTVEQRRCQVLRTVRAPAHELVLFPTGTAATDY